MDPTLYTKVQQLATAMKRAQRARQRRDSAAFQRETRQAIQILNEIVPLVQSDRERTDIRQAIDVLQTMLTAEPPEPVSAPASVPASVSVPPAKQRAAGEGAQNSCQNVGPECPKQAFYPLPPKQYEKDTFESTIGMAAEKEDLKRFVIQPLAYREAYEAVKRHPSNVMLYGPGGTGKTRLVRAVANKIAEEMQPGQPVPPLYSVVASEIMGKYLGSAEQCLAKVLCTADAEPNSSIVLIDEADALIGTPDGQPHESTAKLIATFKATVPDPEEEGQRSVLFAVTNHPTYINDPALVSRFPIRIYVGLPDPETRLMLLEMNIQRKTVCDEADIGLYASLKYTRNGRLLSVDEIPDIPIGRREQVRRNRQEIMTLTAFFSPRNINTLASAASGRSRLGIDNLTSLRYVQRPDGLYDPVEPTANYDYGLTAQQMRDGKLLGQICWKTTSYQDIVDVLVENTVKNSTTRKDMQEYLEYAKSHNDTESMQRIQQQYLDWDDALTKREQLIAQLKQK